MPFKEQFEQLYMSPKLPNLARCHGLAWLDARCPPKPLYHSPSSAGQGRENMTKGLWVEIRTGRDHSPITVTGKTGSPWGN